MFDQTLMPGVSANLAPIGAASSSKTPSGAVARELGHAAAHFTARIGATSWATASRNCG